METRRQMEPIEEDEPDLSGLKSHTGSYGYHRRTIE